MWQSPDILLETGIECPPRAITSVQSELAESKAGFRDRVSIICKNRNDCTCLINVALLKKKKKEKVGTGWTEGGGMGT